MQWLTSTSPSRMRWATFMSTLLAVLFPALLVVAGTPTDQRSPSTTGSTPPIVGLTIPWAAGGLRINQAGATEQFAGEWPDLPVGAVRLWDTRTAWLNLEPAQDQWDFSRLDDNLRVAEANGVQDITMVLWGTPTWAASSLGPDDAPWLGPNSASPPAKLDDWEDFVRHVVRRYAGRITAYEVGNEPNLRMFWRGSPEQYAELVARAARIVHEEDPAALVAAPALLLSSPADDTTARSYFRALNSAQASVDVLAFHWYPKSAELSGLIAESKAVRKAARDTGLPALPIWVTEVGYPTGSRLKSSVVRTLIPQTVAMSSYLGIERLYFYAWSDLPISNLIPLHRGTALEAGLHEVLQHSTGT